MDERGDGWACAFNEPLIYRWSCVRPALRNSSLPLMPNRVSPSFLNMEKDEMEVFEMSHEVREYAEGRPLVHLLTFFPQCRRLGSLSFTT